MLLDSLGGLLGDQIPSKDGWRMVWPRLAEAGVLAAALPESDGGLQDPRALALLAERLGRSGVISPFTTSAVAATLLLGRAPSMDRFSGLRDRLSSGAAIAAIDVPGMADTDRNEMTLVDGRLSGLAHTVPFAAEADIFILTASNSAGERSIMLVPKSDVSIEQSIIGIDGAPYATIRIDNLAAPSGSELAVGSEAKSLIAWSKDVLVTMHCAEAIGAMSMLIDTTRDYLAVRHQFGEPLSSFQVLRHRLVDMDMALTESRSVVECAAGLLEEDDMALRGQVVLAMLFTVARAATKISQDSVQLHGGIGMADETPVGGYFRRLMALPLLWGDEDTCAESYSR